VAVSERDHWVDTRKKLAELQQPQQAKVVFHGCSVN